jgi:spoIIIJ-associated protein
MSTDRTTLEMIAPTIEEAIEQGLIQLNLKAEAVDVEVLDSGSRGLFGIGSRQARVRLSVKPEIAFDLGEEEFGAEQDRPPAVELKAPAKRKAPAARRAEAEKVLTEATEASGAKEGTEGEELLEGDILFAARETVTDLLDKMKIKAQVNVTMKPAEDAEDEATVLVNIEGDDLSILIGRRTETLNALQYVTSLIVGKRLNRWVPLMIDVQGYRARRDRQLRVLARRMADQAIHTGRRQVLEPMPANERRVIHLELRDHPQVATESIGDDPNRKVTIYMKK